MASKKYKQLKKLLRYNTKDNIIHMNVLPTLIGSTACCH